MARRSRRAAGDSAFCRHRILDGCDRHEVGHIVGLAPNAVKRKVAVAYEVAKRGFETAGRKSRLLAAFAYAASTWSQRWQVIARIEHGPKGQNPRFVVTDFEGGPERRLSLDQG